jgi:hypothetical protein
MNEDHVTSWHWCSWGLTLRKGEDLAVSFLRAEDMMHSGMGIKIGASA